MFRRESKTIHTSTCACTCLVSKSCPTLCSSMDCVARQAPLTMGFSRQKYWRGLPCPSSGNLPDPGPEHKSLPSPELAGRFFTSVLVSLTASKVFKMIKIATFSVSLYTDVSDSLQPHGLGAPRLLGPWDFPGKSTGVGCHFLLQYLS